MHQNTKVDNLSEANTETKEDIQQTSGEQETLLESQQIEETVTDISPEKHYKNVSELDNSQKLSKCFETENAPPVSLTEDEQCEEIDHGNKGGNKGNTDLEASKLIQQNLMEFQKSNKLGKDTTDDSEVTVSEKCDELTGQSYKESTKATEDENNLNGGQVTETGNLHVQEYQKTFDGPGDSISENSKVSDQREDNQEISFSAEKTNSAINEYDEGISEVKQVPIRSEVSDSESSSNKQENGETDWKISNDGDIEQETGESVVTSEDNLDKENPEGDDEEPENLSNNEQMTEVKDIEQERQEVSERNGNEEARTEFEEVAKDGNIATEEDTKNAVENELVAEVKVETDLKNHENSEKVDIPPNPRANDGNNLDTNRGSNETDSSKESHIENTHQSCLIDIERGTNEREDDVKTDEQDKSSSENERVSLKKCENQNDIFTSIVFR